MANTKFGCSYGEAQEMKQKIQELSDESSSLRKENGSLKEENCELREQVARLTAQLSAISKTAPPSFRETLGCDAEINELFGIAADENGKVKADISAVPKAFSAFENCIMKAVKPTVYKGIRHGKNCVMLKGTGTSELSEKELAVATEMFRTVIKALAEGKTKMGGIKK